MVCLRFLRVWLTDKHHGTIDIFVVITYWRLWIPWRHWNISGNNSMLYLMNNEMTISLLPFNLGKILTMIFQNVTGSVPYKIHDSLSSSARLDSAHTESIFERRWGFLMSYFTKFPLGIYRSIMVSLFYLIISLRDGGAKWGAKWECWLEMSSTILHFNISGRPKCISPAYPFLSWV